MKYKTKDLLETTEINNQDEKEKKNKILNVTDINKSAVITVVF